MPRVDWNRLYHQQNIQIFGVNVPQMDLMTDSKGGKNFRAIKLKFSLLDFEIDAVPVRLPVMPVNMTPYLFRDGTLYYKGEALGFENTEISIIEWPRDENPWHLKGYTLPFEGTRNPLRELRLNPNISGYCPGKCSFCHRLYSHRMHPDKKRILSANDLFNRISEMNGPEIFKKVEQVVLITELFGKEDRFLQCVSAIRQELFQRGYPLERVFDCSAQDVRSSSGHKSLVKLVTPKRYCFTLEFFRDRQQLMGHYKGLPLDKVYKILESARNAGFMEIQLNYLAGIDDLDECAKGFQLLASLGLIDSVGLSSFTFFSEEQISCRHKTAWKPSYYLNVVEILKSFNIRVYNPESYDMRNPYSILMDKANDSN
ncbi:MAG: hypothetical protein IH589_01125 [Anaerolineales bacterium]|nr:hypothetical protein [Anaerolineales bacterium]